MFGLSLDIGLDRNSRDCEAWWAEAEKRADRDLAEGRYQDFDSIEEMLDVWPGGLS